jgi:hypothetical protein
LRQARTKDVRAAILDAFRTVVSSLPITKRAAPRVRKQGATPARRARATSR